MNAKAKVVVCLVPELRLPHFASAEIQLYGGYEPKIGDALIPLTDHEAALAEFREALQHAQARADAWRAKFTRSQSDKQTLLTGLEALAGEWRKRASGCGDAGNYKMEIAYDCAADELTTLASSATGEKNTEDGS